MTSLLAKETGTYLLFLAYDGGLNIPPTEHFLRP